MEKTKGVYQLDTPFSCAEWPNVSHEDQNSLLDLLCNLLSPIGQHHTAYIKASKGKRAKRAAKRKRGQEDNPQSDRAMPSAPEVAGLVDIGLSNITRNLQLDASSSVRDNETDKNDTAPRDELKESQTELDGESKEAGSVSTPEVPYTVIFVCRSGPPSAFFNHLPQMVAVTSKGHQLAEPIRLVGFSKACEDRLSACMGIPRVTSVALRAGDMAQLKAVVDFVRERVPAVDAPWLEEASKGEYRQTKIDTLQVPIGKKREREQRKTKKRQKKG